MTIVITMTVTLAVLTIPFLVLQSQINDLNEKLRRMKRIR